jgi:hypothetical protein
MKREYVGWLVAGCLLLPLAVVVTLLLSRARFDSPKSAVSDTSALAQTRDSSMRAENLHVLPPVQDLSHEIDSIDTEIAAAWAKMGEFAAAHPPPPGSTIDGTGGPGEEAGVMPAYDLDNATEHIRKARVAGSDEEKAVDVRAARRDLASAKQRIARMGDGVAVERAPSGRANFDVGSNVDLSGLPAFLHYPGATAKGRWSMSNEGTTGTVYSFETPGPTATVVNFYKQALSEWKSSSTMENDEATILVYGTEDAKQAVTVTVAEDKESAKTSFTLLYSKRD